MTADDNTTSRRAAVDTRPGTEQESTGFRSLFSIPPPVKRVFDKFPIVTYEANELPIRAPRGRGNNVLHVFTTPEDAKDERPSFNPACLKWQTFLKFNGIDFRTVPSSNHASPSGALPFLLPAVSASEAAKAVDPVASNKLKRWIASREQGEKVQEPDDMRYEAYASLLDNRIRKAWVPPPRSPDPRSR